MLPIALTCPVWWVARWTARMLASLAVVVACSLGTAALPVGAAATAQAAPHLAAPTSTGGVVGTGVTVGVGAAAEPGLRAGATSTLRAEKPDRDPGATAPAGLRAPEAHRSAQVVPVDRQRVLIGLTPATVGSRAPPAR